MGRRIPTQVHHQVGRLVRAGLLDQPTWLNAVLMNPPLPLPPKAPPTRSAYDQSPTSTSTTQEETVSRKLKAPKNAPSKVSYLEDQVRRQFFKDHPFEAFRPVTLTENGQVADEHPIAGKAWTRLRQHGRNPYPEDAIRFAVSLHEHHHIPLTFAYTRAVSQFRALRSEHFITCRFAALEKETLSTPYPTSEIKLGYEKDLKQLETWDRKKIADASEHAARKRWRAIMANYADSATGWSRGEEYTEKWKEGNQPAYNPKVVEVEYPPGEAPAKPTKEPERAGSGKTVPPSQQFHAPSQPPTPQARAASGQVKDIIYQRDPQPV